MLTVMHIKIILLLGLFGLVLHPTSDPPPSDAAPVHSEILIDDFESYPDGGLPTKWRYLHERKLVAVTPEHMRPKEKFYVVEDGGNKVLRVYTEGEAVHLTMAQGEEGFTWDLETHPRLSWDWRAIRLPEGAREDKEKFNDTGAGFYVFFGMSGFIIKRPVGIKYTYSSTLPVGTVSTYGKLKVIVVSSGKDGYGAWEHIERNVLEDYIEVFGKPPKENPRIIRLWGDSDNLDTIAEADFDNIKLLPKP